VPVAPLILGLILGPMVEENLRAGLIKTGGSFGPFLSRPISLVLWLLLVGSFVGPWIARRLRRSSRANRCLPTP
jgi:TctA family transporter